MLHALLLATAVLTATTAEPARRGEPATPAVLPAPGLDEFIAILAGGDMRVADVTPDLPPEGRQAMAMIQRDTGAAEVRLVLTEEYEQQTVLRFDSTPAMVAAAESVPHYLCLGDILLMPERADTRSWEELASLVEAAGGIRHHVPAQLELLRLRNLEARLEVLRSTIDAYREQHGKEPDFTGQWGTLQMFDQARGGFMDKALLTNPLCPPDVATRVLVLDGTGRAPVTCDDAGWTWSPAEGRLEAVGWSPQLVAETVRRAGGRAGGQTLQSADTRVAELLSVLQTLRSQIELYTMVQQSVPDLASSQWEPLLATGQIDAAPVSTLSPAGVAARIAVIDEAGADGSAVAPHEAGWVWNSADGTLFVAGFSDEHLRAAAGSSSEAPGVDAPSQVRLGMLRVGVANFYANRAVAGAARYPSVEELRELQAELPAGLRYNPATGALRTTTASASP